MQPQLITHNLVILARGEYNWIQKLQGASRGNEDASVLEILSDAFQLATLEGKRVKKNMQQPNIARYVAALQIRPSI